MARIYLVCIVLVISSCATVGTVNFDVNDAGVTEFTFLDARQIGEKTVKLREKNATVTILGDDIFKPSVPVLLKTKIHEKLGSKLAAKKVSLLHLEVLVREKEPEIDEMTYSSSTAGIGIDPVSDFLARWVIKGIEGRKSSKYVVVELKGSLDDQNFNVVENGFFKNNGETEIKRVVLLAVDNAVNSIESLLKEKHQ